MEPKILKKVNDYVIFINNESFSISEWREYPYGKVFFCRSYLSHYSDITNNKDPHLIRTTDPSKYASLEELLENIKSNKKVTAETPTKKGYKKVIAETITKIISKSKKIN